MKTCFKCHVEKPLSEFYKHKAMAGGTLNKCKTCTRKDVMERHHKKMATDPEWVLLERERCRIKGQKYRESNKPNYESRRKASAKWYKQNKIKKQAHASVANAIKAGSLKQEVCEICGNHNTEAHHDDYSKPLDVRWLCVKHHNEFHVKQREKELLNK